MSDAQEESQPRGVAGQVGDGRVFVVMPNSMAVEGPPVVEGSPVAEGSPVVEGGEATEVPTTREDSARSVTDMVEQPAKVMRIGNMIRQLLEEVKTAPLDDASRQRLRAIHATSIAELEEGLAPELVAELQRISLPFDEDSTPSDAELRVAQAQLVGWLEGLFHGIQTALFAQQMAARAQLEQMRRALPPGAAPGGGGPPLPPQPGGQQGMYL